MQNVPIFKEEFLNYMREENSGIYSFSTRRFPELQQLILNEVGKTIIDLANGERNTTEIIDILFSEYEVSKEELEIDVMSFLHNAWRLGVVNWIDNNHPFEQLYRNTSHNYKLLDYDETLKFYKYIDKNQYIAYSNPYFKREDLLNLNYIRERLISTKMLTFQMVDANITMSISYDVKKPELFTLDLLLIPYNYIDHLSNLNDFFNWAMETYCIFLNSNVSNKKIIGHIQQDDKVSEIFNLIKSTTLGTLKNEVISEFDNLAKDIKVLFIQYNS